MSREPVAASVLVMLMVRSPRASGGPPAFDDLFRGLPDDPSSGRPASRDADSGSLLPLVFDSGAPPSRRGHGGRHGSLRSSRRGRGEGWVGAAVCRALVEPTAQVRAVVRHADSAPALDGVAEHVGDFADESTARAVTR